MLQNLGFVYANISCCSVLWVIDTVPRWEDSASILSKHEEIFREAQSSHPSHSKCLAVVALLLADWWLHQSPSPPPFVYLLPCLLNPTCVHCPSPQLLFQCKLDRGYYYSMSQTPHCQKQQPMCLLPTCSRRMHVYHVQDHTVQSMLLTELSSKGDMCTYLSRSVTATIRTWGVKLELPNSVCSICLISCTAA